MRAASTPRSSLSASLGGAGRARTDDDQIMSSRRRRHHRSGCPGTAKSALVVAQRQRHASFTVPRDRRRPSLCADSMLHQRLFSSRSVCEGSLPNRSM